jgi:hypothetical protein
LIKSDEHNNIFSQKSKISNKKNVKKTLSAREKREKRPVALVGEPPVVNKSGSRIKSK